MVLDEQLNIFNCLANGIGRTNHSSIYIKSTNSIIVFGGELDTNNILQTYSINKNTWLFQKITNKNPFTVQNIPLECNLIIMSEKLVISINLVCYWRKNKKRGE